MGSAALAAPPERSDWDRQLSLLSPPQWEAVSHGEGPLLILSGAGSGKTRCVTFRVAHLLREGVDPRELLVCTFTNRAAREFRERLFGILGPETAKSLWMSTLHSAGVRLLRGWGEYDGLDPQFTIYDTDDCKKLVRNLVKELGWEKDRIAPNAAASQILEYKERLVTPHSLSRQLQEDGDDSPYEQDLLTLFHRYAEALERHKAVDFPDLIARPIRMLESNPKLREQVGIRWMMVDEYQDINPAQHRLINLLISPERNLTACGDGDQAIYRFRNADYTFILNFEANYPGARVVSLGRNYRCTPTIVSAAAAVVSNNEKRIAHRLWAEGPAGQPIRLLSTYDPAEEASRVAREISRLHERQKFRWSDVAILCRTNYQTQELEEALLHEQIPYYVFGNKFFARMEIKDTVRYLRWLSNPQDDLALSEIYDRPVRGLSEKSWDKIQGAAREQSISCFDALRLADQLGFRAPQRDAVTKFLAQLIWLRSRLKLRTLSELVQDLLEQTGLREDYRKQETKADKHQGTSRLENLEKLQQVIAANFPGPAEEQLPLFLEYAALMTGDESAEADRNSVQLLTCHAAKGLEWRAVFVTGCEDNLFPHYRAYIDPERQEAIEEERRLFYVAMTRAKEQLYLCRAGRRLRPGGGWQPSQPSPFLDEIPKECVTW